MLKCFLSLFNANNANNNAPKMIISINGKKFLHRNTSEL